MSDYLHLPPSYGDPADPSTSGVSPAPAATSPVPAALFVGFATLEEWARAVDPSRPVLATEVAAPGPSLRGLQTDDLLVVCQQVTPEGHVLYCRLRATSVTRLCGEPFDPDWRERQAAWDSLWACVREFLAERDLSVRQGTVAHPQGYVLFQARGEGIGFDARSGRYYRPAFTGDAKPDDKEREARHDL